jgi:hypothetical protein
MRTPIQEVYENFNKMSDRDFKAWMLNTDLLEKEKEAMQDFATEYERECRINLERSIEKCWDETFNTKDDTSKGIN